MFQQYSQEKFSSIILIFITTLASINCQQRQSQEPLVNYSICETKECLELALLYQNTLNFSISPCQDFLSFACGIINEKTELSAKRVENGVIGNLREKVQDINLELLSSPKIKTPKNALDTVRVFYQSCVEAEHLKKKSVVDMVLKTLKDFGGMPIIPSTNYNPKVDTIQRLAKLFRIFGADPIIGFEVEVDLRNTSVRIPHFSQMEKFGIARPDLTRSDEASKKVVEAYKTFVRKAICILGSLCHGQQNIHKIEQEVKKLVQFEIDLASIALPPEQRSDFTTRFKLMTLKELKTKFPKIPWLPYINGVFKDLNIHFNGKDTVGFVDPEYFSNLGDVLEKTDKRTIANYIGWRIYQAIPVFNTDSLKNITFGLTKVVTGLAEPQERTKICVDAATDNFPLSLGKIFIEKHFSPKVKAELEEFMKWLHVSVKNMLIRNQWMDEATKKQALIKLANIKHQIGYPDWFKNNLAKLEEDEGLPEPFNRDDYLGSMVKFYSHRVKRTLGKLRKPVERDEWITSPATVNAFYNSVKNMITFPAGILQPPLFQLNTLKAVNYGAIGSIIGHEITHGFDNVGNQFDETGNLRDWWTTQTKKEFVVRKKCYIDQYGNVTDKQTGLKLNGELTVGENIADNGGIRGAYEAYLLANKRDERLPGLEQFSDKQIFFISYGRAWCGKYRTEGLRNRILTDSHTPMKYRTFMPPRNFPSFSEAFNCPPGSPMNPKNVCGLW